MSNDSETLEDTKKNSLAEFTADSCAAEFTEIVPVLVSAADDYGRSEFIDRVFEIEP